MNTDFPLLLQVKGKSEVQGKGTMQIRNDWTRAEIQALYEQPFLDLVFQAQQIHRQYFEANTIQVSTLLSIKTGKCPEDCKYCSQSARYDSKLEAEKRIAVEKVIREAEQAKASGSTRFCMGAAWRKIGRASCRERV